MCMKWFSSLLLDQSYTIDSHMIAINKADLLLIYIM